ncbi:MAG: hypothetical protein NW205_08355 [Hyphomicrobiaceae bacterium]|nr:hypothetical protein [Hyphomicrobiaceae bacterium]
MNDGLPAQFKAVRTALLVAAASMLALGAAGCGVKGSLDAPKDVSANGEAAAPAEGSGKKKKHDGFILDGLLR